MRRPRCFPDESALRQNAVHQRRFHGRNAVSNLNASPSIFFHNEGGALPDDHDEPSLVRWITSVIEARGGKLGELSYIFCDDEYLHEINVAYLQHDTLTDIITFPFAEFPTISGDIFISTERVRENATEYDQSFDDELHRVIIHGVLHLCGQSDKGDEEQVKMRELEDWALSTRPAAMLP